MLNQAVLVDRRGWENLRTLSSDPRGYLYWYGWKTYVLRFMTLSKNVLLATNTNTSTYTHTHTRTHTQLNIHSITSLWPEEKITHTHTHTHTHTRTHACIHSWSYRWCSRSVMTQREKGETTTLILKLDTSAQEEWLHRKKLVFMRFTIDWKPPSALEHSHTNHLHLSFRRQSLPLISQSIKTW